MKRLTDYPIPPQHSTARTFSIVTTANAVPVGVVLKGNALLPYVRLLEDDGVVKNETQTYFAAPDNVVFPAHALFTPVGTYSYQSGVSMAYPNVVARVLDGLPNNNPSPRR